MHTMMNMLLHLMIIFIMASVAVAAATSSGASSTSDSVDTATSSDSGTQMCSTTVGLPPQINIVADNTCATRMGQLQETVKQLEEKVDRIERTVGQIAPNMYRLLKPLMNTTNDHEHGEYQPSPLLHSCDEIKATWPDSTSDYYLIADGNGHTRHVYCSMEYTCGDAKGGWMRVAYLNMSDPSEQCPPGFRLYEENGVRACGRKSGPGCQSVTFPSYDISYTRVCGRVTGYQKGSTDGIVATAVSSSPNNHIDQTYVDGVSITQGSSRKHIWTFMAALQENNFAANGAHECPCAPNSPVSPPSFVGNAYFCESGQPGTWDRTTFLTADPLWDGKQCGLIEKACCLATGIPWFNKVIQQPTTDYIELRVCGNQDISDEDVPVGLFEIYSK